MHVYALITNVKKKKNPSFTMQTNSNKKANADVQKNANNNILFIVEHINRRFFSIFIQTKFTFDIEIKYNHEKSR